MRTVVQRLENGEKHQQSIFLKASDFEWFSLVLDELAEVTDTAQLLLFIPETSADFVVTEELDLWIICMKQPQARIFQRSWEITNSAQP